MARSSPLTRAVEQLAETVAELGEQYEVDRDTVSKTVNLTRRIVVNVLDDVQFAEDVPQEMRANLHATLSRLL